MINLIKALVTLASIRSTYFAEMSAFQGSPLIIVRRVSEPSDVRLAALHKCCGSSLIMRSDSWPYDSDQSEHTA